MQKTKLDLSAGFAVLMGNAAAQAAVMTLRPHESTGGPGNRHPDSDQWLYVASGLGEAVVEGRRLDLEPGVLLLIERGEAHEIRCTGPDPLETLDWYVPPAYSEAGEPLPSGAAPGMAAAQRRLPVRCSVAAVVRGEGDAFLAVRRPPDDDRLPNVWGLPAVTLAPGELPEDGIRRVGSEKLGADIEPVCFIGIRSADRGEYELILMDMEARVTAGVPDVSRATTSATRYVEQRWTSDPTLLREAAHRGSLCSQILLDAHGLSFEQE